MHMHLSFKSVLVNECDQQTRYKDRQECYRICWGGYNYFCIK